MSAVNVANIQQKKIIQPNLIVQNDETSSMANSSPPTGAPKAAATPAAAPAVVKLRLKDSNSCCVCRIDLHTMEALRAIMAADSAASETRSHGSRYFHIVIEYFTKSVEI